MKLDRPFTNVILSAVAFMLIFSAFQTMVNIEQTILKSITKPSFTADAFISSGIVYAVFALANWVSPSVIAVIGPKFTMVIGGVMYLLFIAGFYLEANWSLYLTSAFVGIGAALIWTGQGNYLTLNSTEENISRNSGVFWAIFQSSFLFGNLFVYFLFQGKDVIDQQTRTILYSAFLGPGILGVLLLMFLPQVKDSDSRSEEDRAAGASKNGPVQAFKSAVQLFFSRDMAILSFVFFYIGIEFSFLSGVYSPTIGFTKQLPDAKRLVGLSGIMIGVGEIAGGAIFGILGKKTTRFGRDPIILLGFLTHAVGFFIIFLNIPNTATQGDTYDMAYIPISGFLAVFSSFLVGFGDACFNTQVYSILGGLYPTNSAPAFALYKFVSSLASAANFLYSPYVSLHTQLIIITVFGFAGTISFWLVEWRTVYHKLREVTDATETNDAIETAD